MVALWIFSMAIDDGKASTEPEAHQALRPPAGFDRVLYRLMFIVSDSISSAVVIVRAFAEKARW